MKTTQKETVIRKLNNFSQHRESKLSIALTVEKNIEALGICIAIAWRFLNINKQKFISTSFQSTKGPDGYRLSMEYKLMSL